jgi:predicted DsbA family dithiol-disulfide isomerase
MKSKGHIQGGVPAFVANRQAALTGVQPVENLKKLVERVRA